MMYRFRYLKVLNLLILVTIPLVNSYGMQCDSSKIRLEYKSQRWLTTKELKHFEDMFGLSLAVKLRLVDESECTFYFLSDKNYIRPHGYQMFRKKGRTQWDFLPPSRGREGPPGAEFTNTSYVFLGLLPKTSIEYEVFDWNRAGEEHAFTTFVKQTLDGPAIEIISDIYVPFRK